MRGFHLAAGFCLGLAAAAIAVVLAAYLAQPHPPPTVSEAAVVRVLDVTIKDSNVSNRRQRFECRPVVNPAVSEVKP